MEKFRDDDFDSEKVPGEFDLFEAMDRTSQVFQHLESALYNHPGLDTEQAVMAQKAFDLLFGIYQKAGTRFFKMTEDDKDSTQG